MVVILNFEDLNYFNECINDLLPDMVPVTIRRTYIMARSDPNYPDSPLTAKTIDINVMADVAEMPMNEIAHSGGVLLSGDLRIWCREFLRGPGSSNLNDSNNIADVVLIHGQEYQIVGSVWAGRMKDPVIAGYTANLRRRVGA